jgi:hypothetical protein
MKSGVLRDTRRRGSSLIEFALAGSFIFLPLMAGLTTIGFQMVVAVQVASLTTGAGRMFASGVTPTQAMLQTMLGSGLNLSTNGEVILSQIQNIAGQGVICTQQIVIGNGSTLPASKYVPGGAVSAALTSLVPLALANGGQTVYLAEVYAQTPNLVWSGLLPGTGGPIYNKAIF